MSYDLTGTLLNIEPEQTFASGFSKREFVITTDDKYPQCVKLEFTKDKCAQLDRYREGDLVRVHFNLRGNEHLGRYYVNLVAWKIEDAGSAAPAPGGYGNPPQAAQGQRSYPPRAQHAPAPAAARAPRQGSFYPEEDDDSDVPF